MATQTSVICWFQAHTCSSQNAVHEMVELSLPTPVKASSSSPFASSSHQSRLSVQQIHEWRDTFAAAYDSSRFDLQALLDGDKRDARNTYTLPLAIAALFSMKHAKVLSKRYIFQEARSIKALIAG
ncbi:hypothetical protein Plhal304r1_c062g0149741 [Plasmopara halstedii]